MPTGIDKQSDRSGVAAEDRRGRGPGQAYAQGLPDLGGEIAVSDLNSYEQSEGEEGDDGRCGHDYRSASSTRPAQSFEKLL